MRKIILSTFVSLDGVMQGPSGPHEDTRGGFEWGGWQVNYWDDFLGNALAEVMGEPFDLLLGRRTYEIFAAYWPYISDGPIAEKFNKINKYVVCNNPLDLIWKNSIQIKGNIVAELKKLKQQDGSALLIQGSSVLVQTLLEANLIDTLHLWNFPVTLGTGKRLFGNGTRPAAYKFTGSKISSTGVVVTSYAPAGELVPGNLNFKEPSAAELARREKWKSGEL